MYSMAIRDMLTHSDDDESSTLHQCRGYMGRIHGLPCAHVVRHLLQQKIPLSVDHFESRWHISEVSKVLSIDTIIEKQFSMIREPAEERGRGKPKTHQRGTKRLPSKFQHAEKKSWRRKPTSSQKSMPLLTLTASQALAEDIAATVRLDIYKRPDRICPFQNRQPIK